MALCCCSCSRTRFGEIEIDPVAPEITLGGGGDIDETVAFLVGTGIALALFNGAPPAAHRRAIGAATANATVPLRPIADAHQHELVPSHGDRTRLGRIVTNLVTDAIRVTPTGGTITSYLHVEREREIASISVSDNGPGTSADDLPHVFGRFYRAELARPVTGSGVGLAVLAQLVEAHQGWVGITSWAPGHPDRCLASGAGIASSSAIRQLSPIATSGFVLGVHRGWVSYMRTATNSPEAAVSAATA